MRVTIPSEMSLTKNNAKCKMIFKDNFVEPILPDCAFKSDYIVEITNGLNKFDALFTGHIEIDFEAINPRETLDLDQSIELFIFEDSDFQYPIDEIL